MKKIIVVILVAIIGVFASLGFYYGFLVMEVHKMPMDLKVGNKVGFNTATDAIHFGTIYPGGASSRKVTITNENPFPIKIAIRNRGNISDLVNTDTNSMILPGMTNATIIYTASPPGSALQGTYSGMSSMTMKRILW